MALTSDGRKYPARLYEEGKAPIKDRSMNHNCFLGNLSQVREETGEDVWKSLRDSSLGVFIKLQESEYIWSGKTVHHFLVNQLAVKRKHEFWCLIRDEHVRLLLHEFADITGLNCDPLPQQNCDVDHSEFWKELGLCNEKGIVLDQGPKFDDLKIVLGKCRGWSFEKRRMLAQLCLLSVVVYGIAPGSRIPFDGAKRVLDAEMFEKYPWGRVAFSSIMESIKVVCFEGSKTYIVRGCVHALLVWAYESFPALGADYGCKKEGNEVPLLSWRGSRKRFKFADLIANEVKNYNKV